MSWVVFSYSLPSKAASSARVAVWRRLWRLGAISPAGGIHVLVILKGWVLVGFPDSQLESPGVALCEGLYALLSRMPRAPLVEAAAMMPPARGGTERTNGRAFTMGHYSWRGGLL